ncbi:MAG: polyprenyl synthetase family protein, partial [Pikeienuella sp.]
NVGDDFREGKATLPVFLCAADADATEAAFWTRVIEDHEQEDGDLEQALAYFAAHNALDRTKARAAEWGEVAVRALDAFPDGGVKQALADVVSFVVSRAH